jgi:hypothetical protein
MDGNVCSRKGVRWRELTSVAVGEGELCVLLFLNPIPLVSPATRQMDFYYRHYPSLSYTATFHSPVQAHCLILRLYNYSNHDCGPIILISIITQEIFINPLKGSGYYVHCLFHRSGILPIKCGHMSTFWLSPCYQFYPLILFCPFNSFWYKTCKQADMISILWVHNLNSYMLLSRHQNAGQNHDVKIGNRCF